MDPEIVEKAEALRSMYLIKKILKEEIPEELVVNGKRIKESFNPFIQQIEKGIIPFLERQLPYWAKNRARETFDLRKGFVIWE